MTVAIRLPRFIARRPLRPSLIPSTTVRRPSSSFQPGPSPPRLPPREQAEFEHLQRTANTQQGFSPSATAPELSPQAPATSTNNMTRASQSSPPAATNQNTISNPLRKGAPPEFEGDVNPKTGEVGGPKNEPLRWGAQGDYSFNGRVTDF